jgi:hypothetical protein
MASRQRYERVRWAWCSVHLGVAREGSNEACTSAWNSDLGCSFWKLYAARGGDSGTTVEPEHSDGQDAYSERAAAYFDGLRDAKEGSE